MKPILTILCLVILALAGPGCASTREETQDYQALNEYLARAKYQTIKWNPCPTIGDGYGSPYRSSLYPRYETIPNDRARAFRKKTGPSDWWKGLEE